MSKPLAGGEDLKKRIVLDDNTRDSLMSKDAIPTEIMIRGNKYYPKKYIAGGYKGVVWKGLDAYGGDVAIKFTIHEDYMDRSYLEEAQITRQLRGRSFFADFFDVDLIELTLPSCKKTFVVFIEEWIDGWTLSDYLSNSEVSPPFLISYLKGMCCALNVLYELGLRHDDLHSGNIMVAKPKVGDMDCNELKIKLIDMGSLKSADQPTNKEKDDHRWFVEHLINIRNLIRKRKALSLFERSFIKEVDLLLSKMLEEDRGAALWHPATIITEFESASSRARRPMSKEKPKLNDLFDYIAAEHIESDKLLVELFAESCPWFKDVSGPNPILLTGPRGCGKSMVFRRLSLKALLYKDVEALNDIGIAGFYISCSSDLRNRLYWLTEKAAHKFRKEIVHYFNLLLVREVVQTLIAIGRRADRFELFTFSEAAEKKVHSFLLDKLKIDSSERLRLQGLTPMEHTLDIIEAKMDKCYQDMIQGFNTEKPTDSAFLTEFTRFLANNISLFSNKKITFLVDDFSIHRIPKDVQRVLNPIVWDRQKSHIFKLSAEKYGAIGADELNGVSESTRELREIDCGQFYVNLKDAESRVFAKELLAKRMTVAGYEGSPEDILGHSSYEEGSLGKYLRERAKNRGRIEKAYHGLETIADICSGDVSILLEIYRRIFVGGKVEKSSAEQVKINIQHKAIVSVSREHSNLIKSYVPYGEKMHQIVHHFGILSRRVLREGRLIKHGANYDPSQTSRIELHQPPVKQSDILTKEQDELMDELIRRAIFIQMESGLGRRKLSPTLRWQLRRIYCPAFGTTLAKNTSFMWDTHEFKEFLINPEVFCEKEFNIKWKDTSNDLPEEKQRSLDEYGVKNSLNDDGGD